MNNSEANNATEEQKIGLAGGLTKVFIHSPLTPLLLVGFFLLGIMGLMFTPRQEDPQISVPMVDIFVQFPGASASQVNNQVAVPLEQLMMEIKGVDHVYSASMRDQTVVTIQFEVGEHMGPSLVKLYDKLNSNMDKIPYGVSRPLVKPKGIDDVPVVTLTLWSEEVDDSMLRLISLDLLKHIKRLPNTAQGFVVSGRRDQMTVRIYPEKLSGHGITMDQLVQTIKAANTEVKAGNVEIAGHVATIYSGGFIKTHEDLERLMVGQHNGRPVYLRDVAEVVRGPDEAQSLVSYYTGAASGLDVPADGASAVTLAIAKKKGSNGVSVAESVLELTQELKGRLIPDNVNVSVTRDYGESAAEKVNELIFKLFVATGAVVLLVWFFLGWRAAVVVAIVVPVVILFTVFMALVIGFTIDRVSLFALIFSIGILVDDAIVVVENVYRRWLMKGEVDTATTIAAVAEVGNPTILATFTVVAALLPMAAVRGMMGPYMAPIPALGSVAMVFSLFAAFVFTPWLALKLKPSMAVLHKAEEKEEREVELLGRFYRRVLLPMIENKLLGWMFMVSLFVVFFISIAMFYTKSVKVKMLPLDNKPEFNVVVNFPEGAALPVTANLVGEFAERIRAIDEVVAIQTYVGTASPFNFNGLVRHYYLRSQPWEADLQIQLLNKKERERSSHEIAVQVREMLKPLAEAAGAKYQVVEMPPGPPVLQSVVAEVYGPDPVTRRQVARDLEAMFNKAEHLDDVDTLMQDEQITYEFHVDREKAQRIGVTVADVNRTLQMVMGGFQVGDIKYHSDIDVTPLVIEAPLSVRGDFGRIGQLPVPTQAGGTVPLSEIGRVIKSVQHPTIFHKDLRPVEFVTAETVGDLAAPIYGMMEVEALLKDYVAPDGVEIAGTMMGPPEHDFRSGFEWAGEWTVTYETFRDMGIAFGVALILIYMLVVAEFGNFLLPAIVMAPIPLTLVGIIPGHWLLNAEFTATSMIGFIALAGIIVRNSILLVDFSSSRVREGMPVIEALVVACQTRTRPIVITALALVGGSSVILFDPIFQGMAVSLLFGVLVSTALTLFIIPLGCYSSRAAFHCDNSGADPDCEPGAARGPNPKSKAIVALRRLGIYLSILLGLLWKLVVAIILFIVRLLKRKPKALGGPPNPPAAPPAPAQPKPKPAGPQSVRDKAPELDNTALTDDVTEKRDDRKTEKVETAAEDEQKEAVKESLAAKAQSVGRAEPEAIESAGEMVEEKPVSAPKKATTAKTEKTVRKSTAKKKSGVKKAAAPKKASPVRKPRPAKKTAAAKKASAAQPITEAAPKRKNAPRGIRLKNIDD